MSSGPHLNTRRAALRPAGHGLDIPDLHTLVAAINEVQQKDNNMIFSPPRIFIFIFSVFVLLYDEYIVIVVMNIFP